MTVLIALLAPAHAGWRDDVAAAVAACATDPAPCDAARDLALRPTRAGHLMAQDPALDDPAVIGPLLDRLVRETDPAIRVGLADGVVTAIVGDPTDTWHDAWADLAATDPQAQVRIGFVISLRRAPLSAAGPGLRAAVVHADPATRKAAASTMGGHADAKGFVQELVKAAADPDATVRAAAVKALGWAGDASALAVVQGALTDEDGKVRYEAERAVGRLGG